MQITNIAELQAHMLTCYPQEGCGIVVENKFIPLANEADNPAENFKISDDVYFLYKETLQGVIHSHTMQKFELDGRTPSHSDMQGAEATELPWGIVHCDGENVSDLLWFNTEEITPLINRTYIPNVYDCFTLSRDYYRLHYNYDVGIHPRPPKWEEWDITYIANAYLKYNFKVLNPSEPLQVSDVLLFKIGLGYPSHIGIVTGENTFIHHLYNKKSCEDRISKWNRQLVTRLRFTGES